MAQLSCDFCGDSFEATRTWQKFCSDKCRNAFNNEKKSKDIALLKCPHCKNEELNTIELIGTKKEQKYYLCNVCSKEFFL